LVSALSPLKEIANILIEHNRQLEDCEDIESKIAISLLMAHLIPADGKVLECETDRLAKLVARRFGVEQFVVRQFMDLTELNRRHSVTIEDLTAEIKSRNSEKKLQCLVRDLWDIALVDDELHSLEETLIYHVADKLGLKRRDVIGQQSRVCS